VGRAEKEREKKKREREMKCKKELRERKYICLMNK
jgi:hypothetical protein